LYDSSSSDDDSDSYEKWRNNQPLDQWGNAPPPPLPPFSPDTSSVDENSFDSADYHTPPGPRIRENLRNPPKLGSGESPTSWGSSSSSDDDNDDDGERRGSPPPHQTDSPEYVPTSPGYSPPLPGSPGYSSNSSSSGTPDPNPKAASTPSNFETIKSHMDNQNRAQGLIKEILFTSPDTQLLSVDHHHWEKALYLPYEECSEETLNIFENVHTVTFTYITAKDVHIPELPRNVRTVIIRTNPNLTTIAFPKNTRVTKVVITNNDKLTSIATLHNFEGLTAMEISGNATKLVSFK
jgi:hypothetical protein